MSDDKKDGMLEVDDNFGLDDSDEDNEDNEFGQGGDDDQQIANFDDDNDEEDDDDEFGQDGQHQDNDQDDEDEDDEDNYKRPDFAFNSGNDSGKKNEDLNTKKVENQQFDEALDIDDSNEIESDDDDGEANDQVPQMSQANQAKAMAGEDDEDGEEVPGQYNAANYANLNVSSEVKELFEYIGRYKPQKINLETTLKPFIPEYIPCVGEVDAFLKMPKPDGAKEDLGITVLDEPALNTSDPSLLEIKYIQHKQVGKKVEVTIRSIENAEKNPKNIQNWIKNVNELHESRPPATVQYTKVMPDFDNLMEVWPPQVENVLRDIPFPGPDIDLSTEDYARTCLAMLDIPVHSLPDNKGIIEALHVMFTLYSTFKENQHFKKQQQDQVNAERGKEDFLPLD